MATSVYLLTICLPLATVLLIFGMKYVSAFAAAKAERLENNAYRKLAEDAVALQRELQANQTQIGAELGKVAASLGSIEKLLRQVG